MLIRITSKKEGFRRCGIAHSEKPTIYPDDRFSAEELKILEAEPMLIVERIPEEAKESDPEEAPGRKARTAKK